MKRFKRIKTSVFIFLFILICLFIHDLFTFYPKSENLFFPKLHENYCFSLAFEREIKDEKVISFECSVEMWGGSIRDVEIIMFCYEGCGTSGDIFSPGFWMNINQKTIAKIEKDSQQYKSFDSFKRILKEKYYRKHRKPLTEAIVSHFYYSSPPKKAQWEREMLWYDHYSKILWYKISAAY